MTEFTTEPRARLLLSAWSTSDAGPGADRARGPFADGDQDLCLYEPGTLRLTLSVAGERIRSGWPPRWE
jgi:hypothetical protein